ncbi:hypothetical protein NEUTE2DRAFT_72068 [Neurospora tetrasperma FGSC 2509]|nr:hypothetical protein NEUTE2DRAFT_72068 [Neurospora tetrasperma FGSC 2509]
MVCVSEGGANKAAGVIAYVEDAFPPEVERQGLMYSGTRVRGESIMVGELGQDPGKRGVAGGNVGKDH